MTRSAAVWVVALGLAIAGCSSGDAEGGETISGSTGLDCAAEAVEAALDSGVGGPALDYTIPEVSLSVECDLAYATSSSGIEQTFTVYRPVESEAAEALPAVVFFHFNGDPQRWWWPSNPEIPLIDDFKLGLDAHARILAAEGVAAITFNYHYYPMRSDHGEVGETTMGVAVDDAAAFMSYLGNNASTLGIDPDDVCFWTVGTGSLVGAYTALTSDLSPQCVVVFTGTLSESYAGRYDPAQLVDAAMPAFFVVRANLDTYNNDGVDRFASAARTAGAEQVTVERVTADHSFEMFGEYTDVAESTISSAVEFILEHIGAAS